VRPSRRASGLSIYSENNTHPAPSSSAALRQAPVNSMWPRCTIVAMATPVVASPLFNACRYSLLT